MSDHEDAAKQKLNELEALIGQNALYRKVTGIQTAYNGLNGALESAKAEDGNYLNGNTIAAGLNFISMFGKNVPDKILKTGLAGIVVDMVAKQFDLRLVDVPGFIASEEGRGYAMGAVGTVRGKFANAISLIAGAGVNSEGVDRFINLSDQLGDWQESLSSSESYIGSAFSKLVGVAALASEKAKEANLGEKIANGIQATAETISPAEDTPPPPSIKNAADSYKERKTPQVG